MGEGQFAKRRNVRPVNMREFWTAFYRPASIACTVFGGYAGIISALSLIQLAFPLCVTLIGGGLMFFFAALAIIAVRAFNDARSISVKQSVTLKKTSVIEVRQGGFVESLRCVCGDMKSAGIPLENLICVTGFSQNLNLESTTEGSVLMSLLRALAEENEEAEEGEDADDLHRPSLAELLEAPPVIEFGRAIELAVDDYWASVGADAKKSCGGKAPFGTGILVDLPLLFDDKTGKCGKLLLIVNSRQNEALPHALRDVDAITGPNTIDVVPRVFEALRDVHFTMLVMPALGTNRLANSYKAVISSIVNRYLSSLLERQWPFGLVISVREIDLARNNMSLVQVKKYVRDAVSLFS